MTSDQFTKCGEAMFGSRWQTDLGEALGINDRTIRRYVSGQNVIPDGVAQDILNLMATRAETITRLQEKMRLIQLER